MILLIIWRFYKLELNFFVMFPVKEKRGRNCKESSTPQQWKRYLGPGPPDSLLGLPAKRSPSSNHSPAGRVGALGSWVHLQGTEARSRLQPGAHFRFLFFNRVCTLETFVEIAIDCKGDFVLDIAATILHNIFVLLNSHRLMIWTQPNITWDWNFSLKTKCSSIFPNQRRTSVIWYVTVFFSCQLLYYIF